MSRKSNWTLRRWRLWRIKREWMRADGMCFYCGVELRPAFATLDHLVPRSKGGSDERQNLVLACRRCNRCKAADPPGVLMCLIHRKGLGCVRKECLPKRMLKPIGRLATMTDEKSKGYDYRAIDAKLRRKVQRHAEQIHQLLERTTETIVEIGRRLIEVHSEIGRSRFQAWLKAEFRWSQPTASQFMSIAEQFGHLDCLNNFQPSALYKLAPKSVPAELVAEMIQRAESGETITHKMVADAIRAATADEETDESLDAEPEPAAEPMKTTVGKLRFDLEGFRKMLEHARKQMPPADVVRLADQLMTLATELKSSVEPAKPSKRPGRRPATRRRRPAAMPAA